MGININISSSFYKWSDLYIEIVDRDQIKTKKKIIIGRDRVFITVIVIVKKETAADFVYFQNKSEEIIYGPCVVSDKQQAKQKTRNTKVFIIFVA